MKCLLITAAQKGFKRGRNNRPQPDSPRGFCFSLIFNTRAKCWISSQLMALSVTQKSEKLRLMIMNYVFHSKNLVRFWNEDHFNFLHSSMVDDSRKGFKTTFLRPSCNLSDTLVLYGGGGTMNKLYPLPHIKPEYRSNCRGVVKNSCF